MGTELEQDGYVYPGKRIAKNGAILGEGQGMTLRDWFAGKAMAAIITTSAGPTIVNGLFGAEPNCAFIAYKMADAMIAARDQSND